MSQIVIRLADLCNLECKMCDFVHSSNTYGQKMNIEDFRKIVKKLKNAYIHGRKIDLIRLDGNREGLLYPNITEAVHIVKEEGFKAFLVTNGVNMTAEMADRLISSGLNSINFSVCGITEETYMKFQGYKRPAAQLSQVLDNIKRFVEINKGRTFVSVSMLLNDEENLGEEYRKAFLFYKNMGVNSVLLGSEYPKEKEKEVIGSPNCLAIPLVGVNGEVFPCCGGSESFSLGNIFSDNAEEIFDGNKMHSLYKGLKQRDHYRLPSECGECIYNGLPERKTESFFFGEDFSDYIDRGIPDFICSSKGKKVYLVGANLLASECIEVCKEHHINVEAIIDNDYLKWGDIVQGVPVIGPKEALNSQIYINCIKNQSIGIEIMKKYEGKKYLYALFLECFRKQHPVFSYSYIFQ